MKRLYTFRRRLFAPLVYLAALFLIFEEWLWDVGARLMERLAQFPPLHALERFISRLGPLAALALFTLPALLLFPVKLLALFAMAKGHAMMGLSVFVIAKVAGAAAVARLYALTRPALLQLAWFARIHNRFIELKDRWIARLKATAAWQECRDALRACRDWLRRLRRGRGGRFDMRPLRVLRRFSAFWRARRR
ncbi:hypothetical protein [Pseudoduganella sp. RAF53_2]|uniref:hypothetical protein n=1 Tax=unclassified Pseudoduganella TaxID=2637179 RepID=UPI003F9AFFAD